MGVPPYPADKINVQLPTAIDAQHQGLIDALNKATPADFDKIYAEQQEEAHDDAALKCFAAKVLPVINQHKQVAERIDESL